VTPADENTMWNYGDLIWQKWPDFNKKARNSHSNLRSNLVWDG